MWHIGRNEDLIAGIRQASMLHLVAIVNGTATFEEIGEGFVS